MSSWTPSLIILRDFNSLNHFRGLITISDALPGSFFKIGEVHNLDIAEDSPRRSFLGLLFVGYFVTIGFLGEREGAGDARPDCAAVLRQVGDVCDERESHNTSPSSWNWSSKTESSLFCMKPEALILQVQCDFRELLLGNLVLALFRRTPVIFDVLCSRRFAPMGASS